MITIHTLVTHIVRYIVSFALILHLNHTCYVAHIQLLVEKRKGDLRLDLDGKCNSPYYN